MPGAGYDRDCSSRSDRGSVGRTFVLVVVDDDQPERVAGRRSDALPLLRGATAYPLLQVLRLVDLARVGTEGLDLAIDRRRHVDPRVRPFRPEEVQAAD